MKALTILQPWASLIACGAKKIETRSWATKYRGALAIHAAKFMFSPYACELPDGLTKLAMDVLFPSSNGDPANIYDNWHELPHGCVIAIADLVDCMSIVYYPGTDVEIAKRIEVGAESSTTNKRDPNFSKIFVPTPKEIAFGDWTPGRYAWLLENVRPIEPIPAKGMQRIWEWETPWILNWEVPPCSE